MKHCLTRLRESIAFAIYATGMLIALAGARLQNKETFRNMVTELRKQPFRTHANN